MNTLARMAVCAAPLAPLLASLAIVLRLLLVDGSPSERTVTRVVATGLGVSVLATLVLVLAWSGLAGVPVRGDLDFAEWLRLGDFVMLTVFRIDGLSVTLAVFAAVTTALVARFSRTYLHREPGFVRFFTLLGVFAAGTQLILLAGALELFFAGWELIGIASACFIGYFHQRAEPVRSAIRAFATYRLSDAGLLIATVATFEILGSTRFSALAGATGLPAADAAVLAGLFLLSAMGKSAQLPFSGWLPRAMEGPTPSSALFYGAVSIHAGLFLLLRVSPLLMMAPAARMAGVAVGLTTAAYAAAVARVHTDAKGALAHATLAQVGLILAEIALGWTQVAVVHLLCHAFLRLGQYLKAPNTIHDAHRTGHAPGGHRPAWLERAHPRLMARLYAAALHRLRLDDRIDAACAPILALAHRLDAADRWLCARCGAGDRASSPSGPGYPA